MIKIEGSIYLRRMLKETQSIGQYQYTTYVWYFLRQFVVACAAMSPEIEWCLRTIALAQLILLEHSPKWFTSRS